MASPKMASPAMKIAKLSMPASNHFTSGAPWCIISLAEPKITSPNAVRIKPVGAKICHLLYRVHFFLRAGLAAGLESGAVMLVV